MKYRDRTTIKLARKNQESIERYDPISSRYAAQEKMLRKKFEAKVTDKIWWMSLTKDEKSNVVRNYYWYGTDQIKNEEKDFIIFENRIKEEYPGDLNKQRDIKLHKIINS